MTNWVQKIDTEHKDDDIRNFYWIYKIKLIADNANTENLEQYLNDAGTDGWECFSITQLHKGKGTDNEDPFIRYHFKKRMDRRYTVDSTGVEY